MGNGLSEEIDPFIASREEAERPYRYDLHERQPAEGATLTNGISRLHWLLSDSSRISDAFQLVWRTCVDGIDAQEAANKNAILHGIFQFLSRFDNIGGTSSPGLEPSEVGTLCFEQTVQQLTRAAAMLPQKLGHTEALRFFRSSLLAAQSALAMRSPYASASGDAAIGSGAKWIDDGGKTGATSSPLYNATGTQFCYPHAAASAMAREKMMCKDDTDPLPRSLLQTRLTCVSENASFTLAGFFLEDNHLPCRGKLEVEGKQLQQLHEIFEGTACLEEAVFRALEDEMRVARSSRKMVGDYQGVLTTISGQDGSLFESLQAKAEAAAEEVQCLEAKIQSNEQELAAREAAADAQQREIQAMLETHSHEDAAQAHLNRDSHDILVEIKALRRSSLSLEAEIASEESRASALREAFDGRRARFTAAEQAARDAELGAMRAARRRIAAEAAAKREVATVKEIESSRAYAASVAESKIEATVAEIELVRSETQSFEMREIESEKEDLPCGLLPNVRIAGAFSAHGGVLRQEITELENERDREVECAIESETLRQELDMFSSELAAQLRERESEMNALQRRALRSSAATRTADEFPRSSDSFEDNAFLNELQATETKCAGARLEESELECELKALALSVNADWNVSAINGPATARTARVNGNPIEDNSSSVWRESRQVAAQLGEAQAALLRRRATHDSLRGGDPQSVVEALQNHLRDAENRTVAICNELASASEVADNCREERARLDRQLAVVGESVKQGVKCTAIFSQFPGKSMPETTCSQQRPGGSKYTSFFPAEVDALDGQVPSLEAIDTLLLAGPAPPRMDTTRSECRSGFGQSIEFENY